MNLRPCGHCTGGTEYLHIIVVEMADVLEEIVECTCCGARAFLNDTLGWNNRPPEDAARAEALEDAVEAIEKDAMKLKDENREKEQEVYMVLGFARAITAVKEIDQ